MIISKWLYKIQYLQSQDFLHPEIISKPCPFTKVKLKWPLSRGSHFKVHFCLEFRENRGSSKNFREVPFSRDCKIIKPDSHDYSISITNTYYTYLNMESNPCMDVKKCKHEYGLIHTKVWNKTTNRAWIGPLFFAIFCGF